MHPLIDRLKEKKCTYSNYIPSAVFADTLIDVIRVDAKLPSFKFNKSSGEFGVNFLLLLPIEYAGEDEIKSNGIQP